jgi:hypothetical protein
LTGWAQVCFPYGASKEDARKKLEYDLYYVKHNSPLFDLAILMQTLEVVIWGRSNAMQEHRARDSGWLPAGAENQIATGEIVAMSEQNQLRIADEADAEPSRPLRELTERSNEYRVSGDN